MSFIGREAELTALRTALSLAREGKGQTAILSGDPGIGKTSTIRTFAEIAETEGFCVLWGSCHDDLGAPLFWPWLQLLRAWLACRDEVAVAGALADDAGIIARVVPEVALRCASQTKRHQAGGEAEDSPPAQFRLFHAMAQFWQRASRDQPLLLTIDDLQQDASASLQLLGFVAGAIGDSPILIVGAHRESDLRSENPLSSVLGELVRLGNFHRLRLGGLDRTCTARLLKVLTANDVPSSLSDAVFVHSEGNPLFIQELAREWLRPRAEGWTDQSAIAGLRLPDSIRWLFGQRLSRVSPGGRHLLNMAAVIGRQFD
jgi:predicted ATPase